MRHPAWVLGLIGPLLCAVWGWASAEKAGALTTEGAEDARPGDTLRAEALPDCDDCSDYDVACEQPRGVALQVMREGQEIHRLRLERACDCLCGMHEPDTGQLCGCDAVGWRVVRRLRLGWRDLVVVERRQMHYRTTMKAPRLRFTYLLYGDSCGEVRPLLVLATAKERPIDPPTVAAEAAGEDAWQRIRIAGLRGRLRRLNWKQADCSY